MRKERNLIISIILEFILVFIGVRFFRAESLFLLIGVSIDIFEIKNKYISYSLLVFTVCFCLRVDRNPIYTLILVLLILILSYIKKLYESKVEAQRLYDKLRISEEKLLLANKELENYALSVEELTLLKERNRISREIHDSVGHSLSTAMIQLNAMEALLEKEGNPVSVMARNLRGFINESLQDVRKAVREIKPENYNVYEGIFRIQNIFKTFEKMTGVVVEDFISNVEWELSSDQITNLYRITQESLSNSLKHGKATKVKVIMNFTKDEFILSFKDNGRGCKVIEKTGVGLKGIEERVREMNGTFEASSKEGEGFFLKIVIPREGERVLGLNL
ncbi:MAG: sensor histidine kinase [Clostridium sp.]